MNVEINDDFAETIVQQALLNDYISLTGDLKNPKKLHPDDVAAFKETVAALEVLAKWYFVHGEFDKAVKKARKQK